MKRPRLRFTVWGMMVAVAFMAVLLGLGSCLVGHAITIVRIAFAEDQTDIFEEMRKKTAESAAVDVAPLEYVLGYYPSGTKQAKGSRLDRMVERTRQSAVREIIAILRSRTGLDLGDDPQRWIEGLRASGNRGSRPSD